MNTHNQAQDDHSTEELSDSGAVFYIKVALAFIAMAFVSIGITYTLNKLTIETKGTVVSSTSRETTQAGSFAPGATVYQPVFRFVDDKGIIREAPILFEDSESDYEIGEELIIGYDPDDFSSVRITSWEAHWGFPSFFLALSLFFFWGAYTLDKQHQKKFENEGKYTT